MKLISLSRKLQQQTITKHHRYQLQVLVVIVSVFCLIWAYRSLALSGSTKPVVGFSETASVSARFDSASTPRMDVEVITIRPSGFERSQIVRPRGLFGIAVENRSGIRDLELRLDQVGGIRVRQAQLNRQSLNWKDRFDLNPGPYILTEANHPDWQCYITITEK